jgi:hypothetical protein
MQPNKSNIKSGQRSIDELMLPVIDQAVHHTVNMYWLSLAVATTLSSQDGNECTLLIFISVTSRTFHILGEMLKRSQPLPPLQEQSL